MGNSQQKTEDKPKRDPLIELTYHLFAEYPPGINFFILLDSIYTYSPTPANEPFRSEHIGVVNLLNDWRQVIYNIKSESQPEEQ